MENPGVALEGTDRRVAIRLENVPLDRHLAEKRLVLLRTSVLEIRRSPIVIDRSSGDVRTLESLRLDDATEVAQCVEEP